MTAPPATTDPDADARPRDAPPLAHRGRTVRFSGSRQGVRELLRLSESVPAIPQLRRTRIPRLASIRFGAEAKIAWPILFFKAYARVCAATPELRRVYVRWPWTRLYEHPVSVGRMTVSRPWKGEEVIFLTKVEAPESISLADLDADLESLRFGGPEDNELLRRQASLHNIPVPLKYAGWKAMHWGGRLRTGLLGTFGVTTVSKFGAVTLRPPVFNTTMLSFGPVSREGDVDVVLSYDHRVIDGATNAQAMIDLERELEGAIADELEAMQLRG